VPAISLRLCDNTEATGDGSYNRRKNQSEHYGSGNRQ